MAFFLSSCLESNLDDLPVFKDAEITDFKFEHRWIKDDGKFAVMQLNNSVDIDHVNNLVVNTITIPGASGNFPEEVRSQITLASIVAYCNISVAAVIEPVNGAPKLGVPGDYSAERQYQVTAADGETKKVWTIKTNLNPLN